MLIFVNGNSINLVSHSRTKLSTSDRILELSRVVVPEAVSFLSDSLLVTLLALIYVTAMAKQPGTSR